QHFLDTVAGQQNMTYDGGYAHPDDLAAIYAAVDFVWALDLEREDDNSRWLMPCRFYEAGLFGVPSLAARGFEVGDRVDQEGIGWTFEAPYEAALTAFFEKITRPEYGATRKRLADLPPETFVSGDDTTELCRMLDDGSPPAARP